MEMFLSWCKRARITLANEVTRTSLESYQRYLFHYRKKDGQPLAIASQHSRLAPLKVWFKWLTLRNYISEDPSSELELPRVGYKLPSVLNKDEAELVLKQPNLQRPLGIRDRAILEFFFSTGVRRMELLHLKLYDIDQKHGLVTIRRYSRIIIGLRCAVTSRIQPIARPVNGTPGQLVQHALQPRQIVIGVVRCHIVRKGHLCPPAQRIEAESETSRGEGRRWRQRLQAVQRVVHSVSMPPPPGCKVPERSRTRPTYGNTRPCCQAFGPKSAARPWSGLLVKLTYPNRYLRRNALSSSPRLLSPPKPKLQGIRLCFSARAD
jgi:integrase